MFKRIGLFIAVNLLIVVTISIVMSVLGVQPYLTKSGINYQSLLAFCLIWGFGGAFISLALSRVMAKWMMRVKVIDESTTVADERWLLGTVHRIAQQAGLQTMPQVGFYESDDANAFATGPTKARALVAVSTGLLRRMNRGEIEGVLAHEVAHIANGDMVTMTLVQGVVNVFVMFLARVTAWSISQAVDEDKRGIVNFVAVLAFEIVLGLLGMLVVAAYSRQREFRADSGAANLVGTQKMVAALDSLRRVVAVETSEPQSIAAFKISATKKVGLLALMSTHPPLEERIARLRNVS